MMNESSMRILKSINCHLSKPGLFFTKLCLGDLYCSCVFISFHTEKAREYYSEYSEISVINEKYVEIDFIVPWLMHAGFFVFQKQPID